MFVLFDLTRLSIVIKTHKQTTTKTEWSRSQTDQLMVKAINVNVEQLRGKV